VAGGGGGSANYCAIPNCTVGGAGGGAVGGNGTSSINTNFGKFNGPGGAGGTQFDGGLGADGATSGKSGQGGSGADFQGGGGGGGYFGGAGGGTTDDPSSSAAGGGGSGFFSPDPTRVTGGSSVAGVNDGNGRVIVRYSLQAISTTTTVSSSANPSHPSDPVTFTATVTPTDGTGTVAFFADSSATPLSGCEAAPLSNVSGNYQATCDAGTFTLGTHAITATYSGSGQYLSSSGDLSGGQRVVKSAPAGKPAVRIADASTSEGNSGKHGVTFRVSLSRASNVAVTVRWATANGSAKTPADYVAASGTLNFSPGQKVGTVTVQVKGDRAKEPNEAFAVLLRTPHNATIADPSAVGGIFNDD
jgi:hypothetical protein